MLARVALPRNDLDLAKLIALRAQKLDDRDPELPFVVGQVLARQGRRRRRASPVRKALALREGFLPARFALLEAALKKQAWGTVAEHATAILAAEPGNAPVHLAHGIALRYTSASPTRRSPRTPRRRSCGDGLPEVHLARGRALHAGEERVRAGARGVPRVRARARARSLPEGSPVLKLQRECEQMLEENRPAAEAAKQMQAEAARKAAAKAAKKAGHGAGAAEEAPQEHEARRRPPAGSAPAAPRPDLLGDARSP